MDRTITAGRRALGIILVTLALVPLYRLLAAGETGLAGEVVTRVADVYLGFLWSSMLITILVALLAGWLLPAEVFDRVTERARRMLLAPPALALAAGAALVATLLTGVFTLAVLEGKPSIIDAIVQLLHARYLAEGMAAGPATFLNEFWHIQNSLVTPQGWVSQYPPGHVLLFALGWRLGAVWAVGPVLVGVTVFFTTLAAMRLLTDRPATARLSGVLLALSPFLICLGGSFMNHITSAAMFAVALYCAVRARDGRRAWAIGTGAALGYAFLVRPVSALAVGGALTLALWLPLLRAQGVWSVALRFVHGLAGALPFAGALLAYNAHFFGHPLRLGYRAALGPAMGLGFHRDPWGNVYGPLQALAYTSSDLLTLGVNLLESPVSAVAVIGIWLLVGRDAPRGVGVFAAWALILVASNFLYWHHGIYMGPRMLLEAAPGWLVLATVAGTELVTRLRSDAVVWGRFSPRAAVGGGLAFALLFGLLVLGPQRARSYGGGFIPIARMAVPEVSEPSIVFVHDAWIGRMGMRLAVAGMSLDSVETLVRQNPTCLVHERLNELLSRDTDTRQGAVAAFQLTPRSTGLPAEIEIAPGDKIRMVPGERLVGDCLRAARSDMRGILDIAPLIWQGDLPGVPGTGALFLRDLGPEENARAIAAMPERTPRVLLLRHPEADPELMAYERAMSILWEDAALEVP